jgi:hypothetical protein
MEVERGMKQLVLLGSITGDPFGVKRYMVVDSKEQSTAVSETILLRPDGTEYVSPCAARKLKWH